MKTEPLTVGALVSIETLHSEVLAGSAGLGRTVHWAHSCELDEPWRWLGPDDLLMTVGFCVPQDTQSQVEFVRQLDATGVVAMMIGSRERDLVLSPEMRAEADVLGFPIVRTEQHVPWSAVARHVAAASSVTQTSQVLTLAKLYEIAAMSGGGAGLAESIAKLLRIELSVTEQDTGLKILQSVGTGETVRRRTHQLSSRFAATLEVGEYAGTNLGSMVFVHLKRIIEVESDRMLFTIDARIEAWQHLLTTLIASGDVPQIEKLMDELGVTPDTAQGFRIVAFDRAAVTRVARAAILRKLPVVVAAGDGTGLLLGPERELALVRDLLGENETSAGVSTRFGHLQEARSAVTEAESALADSRASSCGWSEFSSASLSVLARSEREAREIIRDVLGPLADDSDRSAVLRETLFAYLRHERSWAESSAELGIHRQTLSYRLRQIEGLTGRTIAKTEDLAALWIASEAWQKYASNTDGHS